MTVRIETVTNPRVEIMTVADLALSSDEVVVVSGDLEKFARDVWRTVFGQPAPTVTNP